jgi:hypothetical protein
VQDLIAVYEDLARRCDYAIHLGLTEAGMGSKGIVASSAALGILLQQGIGDTIRISLTPEPGGDRTLEVKVAQELLQTMGLPLRHRVDNEALNFLGEFLERGRGGASAAGAGGDQRHKHAEAQTRSLSPQLCWGD